MLQLLETAVNGKVQVKDVVSSLKAVAQAVDGMDMGDKLPDLLWLVGEECLEETQDPSDHKAAFKSLVQELLVQIHPHPSYFPSLPYVYTRLHTLAKNQQTQSTRAHDTVLESLGVCHGYATDAVDDAACLEYDTLVYIR